MPQHSSPRHHPQRDEYGRLVKIKSPSMASPLSAWFQADAIACAIPGGAVPDEINGITVSVWADAPQDSHGWESLAGQAAVEEPAFKVPSGYKPAAGVVVCETDGRVWIVAPTNEFAGYRTTFPKGRLDGASTQAAALREAFEESGLAVRLRRHLIDVQRSESYTRYFLAERIGGDPCAMGWESQAVMLVPRAALPHQLNNHNDRTIVEALNAIFPI